MWGSLLLQFARDDLLVMSAIGAGCAMLAACLEKRSHFCLRVLASFVLAALWMTVTHLLERVTDLGWKLTGTARYTGLFMIFLLGMFFWSRAGFCQALYAITVSYSLQNMCERLIEIPRDVLAHFPTLLDRFCLLMLFAAALYTYFRVCIGDSDNRAAFDFSQLDSRVMLFLSVCVVAVSILVDSLLREQIGYGNLTGKVCLHIVSATFSLLTVIVCTSHLREKDSQRRAELTAHLLHEERARYATEKSVHDAINIRCHDIRHQIAALNEGPYLAELKQIGGLIDIYDAAPRTHSAALDVVLSGKTLACASQHIALTCLADGRRLGFMDDSDIYALFGNILENAIEAASQVEEPRRLISLNVHSHGDLLFIEEENFFTGELEFDDGLPRTTKGDSDYHGFGARSIRMLAQKYGGVLSIGAADGIYRLCVMLPIPGMAARDAVQG